MSVMLDTSQFPIGPFSLGSYGPSKQLPSGDSFRHSLTAVLSFPLDCGENAGGSSEFGTKSTKRLHCDGQASIAFNRAYVWAILGISFLARTITKIIRRQTDKEHYGEHNSCIHCIGRNLRHLHHSHAAQGF